MEYTGKNTPITSLKGKPSIKVWGLEWLPGQMRNS
nr:MAG TPA: hypothetical protein [Caudoviricetes sp.]